MRTQHTVESVHIGTCQQLFQIADIFLILRHIVGNVQTFFSLTNTTGNIFCIRANGPWSIHNDDFCYVVPRNTLKLRRLCEVHMCIRFGFLSSHLHSSEEIFS